MAPDRPRVRPSDAVQLGVVAVVVAYVSALVVAPVVSLAFEVATHLGETLETLSSDEARHAMMLTGILTLISLATNTGLGVVGGLVLVRDRFPGRWLLDSVVDLPLAVSPVMVGLAFLLLFGRNGVLFPWLDALDVKVAFAFPGLVIATLFVTLPLTVREVALVLEELGTAEEDAASTLGASAWQAFVLVTLPNLRRALSLGSVLTVARSLGEFGAVLVLGGAIGGRTQTATTFVHVAMEERHVAGAYGMALLLAAAAAGLLALLQRLEDAR